VSSLKPDPPIPKGRRQPTQFEKDRERAAFLREQIGQLEDQRSRTGLSRDEQDELESHGIELDELAGRGHADPAKRRST